MSKRKLKHNEIRTKIRSATMTQVVAIIIGSILVVVGSYFVVSRFLATQGKPALPDNNQTIIDNVSHPDEKKPSQNDTVGYSVPADQPRKITINSVGISGLIQKVGTTNSDEMAVPSNIFYAGWYVDGKKPSEEGLSIINGHVSGNYSDAIFKNLKYVKINDIIEVEFGDMSVKKFVVVETYTLPEAKSSEYLFSKKQDIVSQMNLITCTGRFNESTQKFDDRIIVVSTPLI